MSRVVNTSSNLIPPDEDVSQYTQAEIKKRILGSKFVLVVEQMQIATIWLVKACLLIMYFRMTYAPLLSTFLFYADIASAVLPQRKLVMITSIYVVITFVVMEILYFGVWCRPFNQYFAVPPNSSEYIAQLRQYVTDISSAMFCSNEPFDHQRRL